MRNEPELRLESLIVIDGWWVMWWLAAVVLLVPVVGYGWAFRDWGPPFPRYVQRRRGLHALADPTSKRSNHEAWGLGGDLVWVALFVLIFAACTALALR